MKKIFIYVSAITLSLYSYSQNKVEAISAFVQKVDTKDIPNKNFNQFVNDEKIAAESVSDHMSLVVSELGKTFDVSSEDYLGSSEYKNMLDGYEYAPEGTVFSLIPYDIETDQVMKQDYRLSEYQVLFVDNYLALWLNRPFKNKEAVQAYIENNPDLKGVIFLQFAPIIGFQGSPYGVGSAGLKIGMTIKLYDRKLNSLFSTAVNSSSFKVKVPLKNYDREEIKNAFDEAMKDLITKIPSIEKKAAKIKWQ